MSDEAKTARIEALEAAITRQAGASKTLRAHTLAEVQHLKDIDRSEYNAAKSLDSEREANAILTAQVEALTAERDKAQRDRDCFKRMTRAQWEALCAMRNSINEYIPMPSTDSGPLLSPEDGPIYADIAARVAARIEAAEAERDEWKQVATHHHSNPADYRYWEGRYRDEKARAEAAEARVKELEGLAWIDGIPPKPWSSEWFIAETVGGDKVALFPLPEEWSYDFKTSDETYFCASRIKRWMQFPDSEYVSFAADRIATLSARVKELEGANAALRAANDMLLRAITGDDNG